MNRPGAPAQWPSAGRRLLVIAGLTGFAISQPLLSVLGDDPTTLAFHGVEGGSLILVAMCIALVPPLCLWALASAVGLTHPRAGRALHLLIVAALVGCFVVQVVKAAGLDQAVALAVVATAAGVAFAVSHIRVAPVATWAAYTAALPVLAAGSFVFLSPSSVLLRTVSAPDRVAGGDELASVVLIVLDELPTRSLLDSDDRIDRTRFPNLAALGDEATWYRHHTTLSPLTQAAVPSLLTGTLPTATQGIWTNHPDNLFSLLAPTHELEVLESATRLCPYDSCAPTVDGEDGVDGGAPEVEVGGPTPADLMGVTWNLWLDRVSLGPEEPATLDDFGEEVGTVEVDETVQPTTTPSITVPDEDESPPDLKPFATSARADGLVEAFDARKGPALYFLHLILPHQPWHLYADGHPYDFPSAFEMALPDADKRQLFSWSPWTSAVSEQRHLLQAEYTDQIVGRLIDGLRAKGLYDDSLVIVTADHGVSFESNTAGRYAEPSTVDAIAYTPLFVKEPGQREGVIDDSNMTTLDIVPTIADRLDLAVPWPVDGAAAGSSAVEARGSGKQIYDMIGLGGITIRGIIEFDDRVAFATVGDRWIGPRREPDQPLSGLDALLGLDHVLGRPLDDVVTERGGAVRLDSLDALRRPPDGSARRGMITGVVEEAPSGAKLVLAIDGVVVGGSELSTDSDGRDGRIAVLLPQGVLHEQNDVRAALVVDGEVRELDVEG